MIFDFSCDSNFTASSVNLEREHNSFKNTLTNYTENNLNKPNTSYFWDVDFINFNKMCVNVNASSTIFQNKAFNDYYFLDCMTDGFIFSESCYKKLIIINYHELLVHANLLIQKKDRRVIILIMTGNGDVMSEKNIFDYVLRPDAGSLHE